MKTACWLDLLHLRMHLHAIVSILERDSDEICSMFRKQEPPLRAIAFDTGCLAISMMRDVVEETVGEMEESPCAKTHEE